MKGDNMVIDTLEARYFINDTSDQNEILREALSLIFKKVEETANEKVRIEICDLSLNHFDKEQFKSYLLKVGNVSICKGSESYTAYIFEGIQVNENSIVVKVNDFAADTIYRSWTSIRGIPICQLLCILAKACCDPLGKAEYEE